MRPVFVFGAELRKRKVHTYTRNDRRQLEADQITTLAGVDSTVQSITRKYDTLGRLTHVTSHGNSTNDPSNTSDVKNQIEYTHNSFGKIEHSYQSHDGEATTSSPSAKYVYDQGKTGNVYDDALRVQWIEYPLVPDDPGTGNPAKLWYSYFATGSLPDRLHRPGYQSLLSGNWLGGNKVILSWPKYNSLSRVVEVSHWRDESPDVLVSRFRSFAFGSNDYAAFDRFGRSLEKKWTNSTSVQSQVDYTYDYASNRLTRSVTGASSLDQTYTYDGLHRLKTNDETGTSNDRYWQYDQLGNWEALFHNTSGTGTANQTRTHNEVNEITAINGDVSDHHYDTAGNMTQMSPVGALNSGDELNLSYDAWNRLVKVIFEDVHGDSQLLQVNEYDGLNRRIVRDETGSGGEKRHFYYNENWQVLVESVEVAAVETPDCMYSYLPNYVDAVAVRMRPNDAHVYLQDANFNVTALVDTNDSSVVERYAYSPYGEVTVLDPNFAVDADGKSDIDNEYLYTGRRRDPVTGLQINRNRFYASHLGRWVNRDPIGYRGGPNLYGYVRNRPNDYRDFLGLFPATCPCNPDQNPANAIVNDLVNGLITGANIIGGMIESLTGNSTSNISIVEYMSIYGGNPAFTGFEIAFGNQVNNTPGMINNRRGSAPSIVIECDGTRHCVGTDKLGHFFEEGAAYHHIVHDMGLGDKGREYAIAWGQWTEGMVPPNLTPEMWDWLHNTTFEFLFAGGINTFPGGNPNKPGQDLFGHYGDTFLGKPRDPNGAVSPADLAANLSGLSFFEQLAKGPFKFDICDFVNEDWDHTQNPNVPGADRGDPPPMRPTK